MNRNIVRTPISQMCGCLALGLCMASQAVGQEPSLFGDTDGAMPATDSFDAMDNNAPAIDPAGTVQSSYFDTDPLVRRIRQHAPTTAAEMAKAITWMVQLRSWETVGLLLDQVATPNWTLERKAQIAREIAPAIWSQLHRSSNRLAAAQLASLQSLHSAPAAYARNPQVIDSLIDQLASPNSSQRQIAELRLQDGQLVSLQRLLDRLLDDDPKVPAKNLVKAIALFDRDGVNALRATFNLPDSASSGRVILGLAEVSSNQFSNELAAGLYSGRFAAGIRQSLAEKIQANFTKLPSQGAAIDFLTRSYQSALDDYQTKRLSPSSLTTTIWQPTSDGKVAHREVPAELASLERLTQLACMLSQLETVEPAAESQSAVIQLQRAYQLNPVSVDAETATLLLQPLPIDRAADTAFWIDVFQRSNQLQMHGAAVRGLQMLVAKIRAGKLQPPMEFLGQLLSDNRPVIRYLALEAIAIADPHMNFSASERAVAVALEMSRLTQGAQALIIGGNNELCMAADQLILSHTGGFRSSMANSARGAFQNLVQQDPIELIVVVDRVHDMSLYEMLQRLRNSTSLPIAVLVDGLYQHEQQLVQAKPGFYASNLSRDPAQMGQVIDELTRMLDVRPLTSDDRTRLSLVAASFLTKISADRNTYSFYPVTQWHEQMISIPTVVDVQSQSQLLSGLGSRESQLQLIALASSAGASEPDRFAAARCFEKSVRTFGLQFRDQGIKDAYEQYNRLGPDDPAIATALGYILDIIEAQTANQPWPNPL